MAEIKVDYSADKEDVGGEPNTCPYCGSENIDYGSLELEGESLYYPVECNDCGNNWSEWHNLVFSGNWGYPVLKNKKRKK